jgi:biopolymer transport protein ExbD
MSAMIDVVFLLLVFFIVTHKDEIIEAHVAINLPSPSVPAGPPPPKPQLLEIQIPPDEGEFVGIYMLMGSKPVKLETLEETLAGIASLDPDQTIIIKMSQQARQEKLINVLDRCKKVGLSKLNVLTLKK